MIQIVYGEKGEFSMSDLIIAIAVLLNSISIWLLSKRIDNIEQWIKYLLEKDNEYCKYLETKRKSYE